MSNKTKPCDKCGRRYRLLTNKELCAYCDYPGWRNKYLVTPIRK